jgi:hypothetical protein
MRFSTCVVSILRLESLHAFAITKDPSYDSGLVALWSTIEINTTILCSCLPTLKGLVTRVLGSDIIGRSYGSNRYNNNNSNYMADLELARDSAKSTIAKEKAPVEIRPPPEPRLLDHQGLRRWRNSMQKLETEHQSRMAPLTDEIRVETTINQHYDQHYKAARSPSRESSHDTLVERQDGRGEGIEAVERI